MEQRALGELAERAAEIAERAELTPHQRAAELGRLMEAAAKRHHYSKAAITALIAGEWDRLGITRVSRFTELPYGS